MKSSSVDLVSRPEAVTRVTIMFVAGTLYISRMNVFQLRRVRGVKADEISMKFTSCLLSYIIAENRSPHGRFGLWKKSGLDCELLKSDGVIHSVSLIYNVL